MDPYPLYFSRAQGAKMWDVDSNEYTDYVMSYGVLVSGHSHPAIAEAVAEQIRNGTTFGFEWKETPKYA